MVIRKNIAILTVEKLEFPFWVLHYAQNLPQNQTYPSTSKWGRKKREIDKLKSASHKYVTNAILKVMPSTNLSLSLNMKMFHTILLYYMK